VRRDGATLVPLPHLADELGAERLRILEAAVDRAKAVAAVAVAERDLVPPTHGAIDACRLGLGAALHDCSFPSSIKPRRRAFAQADYDPTPDWNEGPYRQDVPKRGRWVHGR
jgi:hypothetical protein